MVEEYIRMELYIMEVLKCYLWFWLWYGPRFFGQSDWVASVLLLLSLTLVKTPASTLLFMDDGLFNHRTPFLKKILYDYQANMWNLLLWWTKCSTAQVTELISFLAVIIYLWCFLVDKYFHVHYFNFTPCLKVVNIIHI